MQMMKMKSRRKKGKNKITRLIKNKKNLKS
jgi:hypothetical protein